MLPNIPSVPRHRVFAPLARYRIGGETPALVIDNRRGVYAEAGVRKTALTDIATFARASTGWALDADGDWTSFAAGAPRFDWSTGERAQLIEAQTQNYVWNSGFSGAAVGVVGAGGALPSGWIVGLFDTVEVLEIGTYRGVPAIRLALSYANSSGSNAYPHFANPNSLSGRADTTTYTVSGAARFASMTGASDVPKLIAKDIGGTIGNFAIGSFTNSGDWEEIAKTGTTGTGGSSLSFAYVFAVADGNTLSVDAWFAMPQLELGATRTSFIQTPVGSGATRAADATTKSLAAFDFTSALSVVFSGRLAANLGDDVLAEMSDGTANNRVSLYYKAASSKLFCKVVAGGVQQADTDLGVAVGADTRIGVSATTGGALVIVADGVEKLAATGKTLPAVDRLALGADHAAANVPAILLHDDLWVYEGALSSAELQRVTAA